MAGRLGRIGEPNATAQSTSGRLGRIGLPPEALKIQDDGQKKKDETKRLAQEKLDKTDAEIQQQKADIFNPIKILGDIGNAAKGLGKAVFVDPAVALKKQADTAISGGRTTIDKGSLATNPDLVKNQEDFIRSEQNKGTISKEKADQEVAKLKSSATKATDKLTKAEEKTGVTYNPSEGAFAAIDTISNATGLGEIGKVIFKAAAKKLAEKQGRELGEEELTNLATKTKETVKEAPKPVIEDAVTDLKPLRQNEALPTVDEVIPVTPKKTKSFAPLDQPTQEKLVKLVDESSKSPVPDGMTRLYQTQDSLKTGSQSDQFFKETDTLANYINGRSDNAKLLFKDVPTEDVVNVPGKPQVFKLKSAEDTLPAPKPKETDTVSGNASRIEANAIEKKLVSKFEDKAEFKGINMKEQADEAVKLIKSDKQKAIDIIDGKANPEGNLKAQSVHQALEEIAVKEGDVELLQKLARSHVNTELSESAQNLRIAAERDPASAVENIRQVREARMKAAEKRSRTTVKKETADIRKQVNKAMRAPTKQDWTIFIKELEC